MKIFKKIIIFLVLLNIFIIFMPLFLHAQEKLPVEQRFYILLKVLFYDRELKNRCNGEVNIGVVYDETNEDSKKHLSEIVSFFSKKGDTRLAGMPVNIKPVDLSQNADFNDIITKKNINIVYIYDGMNDFLDNVVSTCNTRKITTLTGKRDFVKKGMAIGAVLKDTKPKILVNLKVVKTIGMDLSSKLLNLAEIVD